MVAPGSDDISLRDHTGCQNRQANNKLVVTGSRQG